MVPKFVTVAVSRTWIPAPFAPAAWMIPELVTMPEISTAKWPVAWMVPEFVTLAVSAWIPTSPPVMVPEFVTLAAEARMPMSPPEMVPELLTLAVSALTPKLFGPVGRIVPVAVLVRVSVPPSTMPALMPDSSPAFVQVWLVPVAVQGVCACAAIGHDNNSIAGNALHALRIARVAAVLDIAAIGLTIAVLVRRFAAIKSSWNLWKIRLSRSCHDAARRRVNLRVETIANA